MALKNRYLAEAIESFDREYQCWLISLCSKLRDFAKKDKNIELLYLFGSVARGSLSKRSDIDVALLLKKSEFEMKFDYEMRLRDFTKEFRIEVLLLKEAPIELAFSVLEEGLIVFERLRSKRVDFETLTMSKYYDYLPIFNLHRQALLSGLGNEKAKQRIRKATKKAERMLAKIRSQQVKKTDRVSKGRLLARHRGKKF